MKSKKAFTLIELLLVFAIITSSVLFLIPIIAQEFSKNNLSNIAKRLETDIYVQQQKAYTGINNSSYGIAFFNNNYVLFEGDSYAAAVGTDVNNLEAGMFFSNIDFDTTGTELIFNIGSSRPVNAGSLRLTNDSKSILININSTGTVELN